ncbi:MAG TPA: ABC transporter ATP-binding protein, partial [Candidatus Gemmiger excrementigallinarum]|nr:ABC transporter ATP-binding protein [Candidatus Gemmiger excrementigallinarum]
MSGQAKSAQEHQNTLRWLGQVAGRYKLAVVGIALLDMVLGASSVAYALLFGNLVDRAASGQMEPFLGAAAALAAMTLGQMLLNAADSLISEWARASLENRFKQRLFACLLHKDYATVTARHSGDWVSRLTSDTAVVAGNMVDLLPRLAGLLARLSGALAALFLLEPTFVYILVPAGCVVLVLTVSLRKILKRMHKRIQEAGAAVLAFVQERLES